MRADIHERKARSEVAGTPLLNQRHERADLPAPSSKTLGDRCLRKCPNPLNSVPRLEGSTVMESNLKKLNCNSDKLESLRLSFSTPHAVEGP